MTKQQVIERFCKLSAEVMEKKFKFSEASDCFCGEFNFDSNFQFSEKIIEFIENSVRKEIDK